MSDLIILYRFRVRHELTGKVLTTRYHLTDDEARQRYGDRLAERLERAREVRQPQEYRGHYRQASTIDGQRHTIRPL
jgi:hypothetical protein